MGQNFATFYEAGLIHTNKVVTQGCPTMTIHDIANLSGVSTSTVSRILNKVPTVKKENQKKVKEIIYQLGYKPNALAQALAKLKVKRIEL